MLAPRKEGFHRRENISYTTIMMTRLLLQLLLLLLLIIITIIICFHRGKKR